MDQDNTKTPEPIVPIPRKWSRYGLFLMGLYGLLAVYLVINAINCQPNYLGCGRVWFVLSLPLYLLIMPLIGKLASVIFFTSFLISSSLYMATLYSLGKLIESAWHKWTAKRAVV